MGSYCAYGSRRRTNFKDTEIPVPDLVQISAQFLADIGLLITGTEWLEPFVNTIIGEFISTDSFCLNGPYADPGPLGIDTFLRSGNVNAAIMQYVNYMAWSYMCECNPGGGGGCVLDPYPGTPMTWSGETRGIDLIGSVGTDYDIYVYQGPDLVHGPTTQPGGIFIMWAYPTSEGGGEPGTHRRVRAYNSTSTYNAEAGTIDGSGPFMDLDSPIEGDQINQYTIMVCVAADQPDPITPPPITPPENPGVPAPITVTCSTLDDVCSAIDRLRTLIRQSALGYIGTSLLPVGTVEMSGDGHSAIVADAIRFSVASIPDWASRTGTDVPYIYEQRGQNELGWWAVGSDDSWYDRHYIHYQEQHSGFLPTDVTRLTWSLRPAVTVTATLCVRQA